MNEKYEISKFKLEPQYVLLLGRQWSADTLCADKTPTVYRP